MNKKEFQKKYQGPGIKKQRYQLIRRLEQLFEIPLIVLAFVWIVLLILEFVHKSSPTLEKIGLIIWVIFIVDFAAKFLLAPFKLPFLKRNIITTISLVVPAFRIFGLLRFIRLIGLTRSISLIKVLGSVNRGMGALNKAMKRRAFGYVFLLTLIVLFVGAAGMYAFEKDVNEGMKNYSSALWWTGMILTTMGSEFWPVTTEGRILCIVIAVYAFTVFGYVTATIATFFIGKDAEKNKTEKDTEPTLEEIRKELNEIKKILRDNNP